MSSNRRTRFRMTWDMWLYALPTAGLLLIWGCGDDFLPGGSDARSKQDSKNNLKQIGLALHNYHDVFGTFPPGGVYTREDKAHHGWQTFLLPYIEQQRLHQELNFNLPWTDRLNRPVFSNTIDQYQIPKLRGDSHDRQGRALSHYAGNSHIFFKNSAIKIRDMTDGTSNTIMVGEVSAGFKPWGDPTNTRDPGKGLGKHAEKFGGPHGDRTLFLLGDGSVREIRNDIAPEVLRNLATPAGNERPPRF